ncbi:MAG: hypothetical protein Q8Q09_22080 [Deltaproteobacteria bacterium]|nr:hypothetical protein [Deltaproteobacteria bacterium]
MSHGLRLTGDARDLATLRTLADLAPSLLDAPWSEVTAPDRAGSVIVSSKLDAKLAALLAGRGCEVFRVRSNKSSVTLTALTEDAESENWPSALGRDASTLVEALRPLRLRGDPIVDEAVFWVPVEAQGAQQIVQRLLLLGRDDVTVSEWDERGVRVLVLRAPNPPMYLLLRAREEPHEGVRAYARVAGGLWVEWGYQHPLPVIASSMLARASRSAFVDRTGHWRIAPSPWSERSIFDAVAPVLDAQRVDLKKAEGESRFTVHLQLANAAPLPPELWLLSPAQFAQLELLIETSTASEITRFTVARMEGPRGVTYVLRELIRPNASRLGTRVSDLLNVRGFVRVAATDNLYLPVARRLTPVLRRDELRKLLGLDHAQAVVLDEDPDGLRVTSLRDLDEVSLARWVDYVATDRRVELDRMMESIVFDMPVVSVAARPKVERERKIRTRDEDENTTPPVIVRTVRHPIKPEPVAEIVEVSEDETLLRDQARALELRVADGACDDSAVWRDLAALKARLRHHDEAAQCLESAMFHGLEDADAPERLLELRRKTLATGAGAEDMLELAVRRILIPTEASLLGAGTLSLIARNDPALDTMAQQIVQRFGDPELPASRRLAWLVLSGFARRSRDRLGMTRAKERLLGGINERGLHEVYDLPGFVRYHLALEGDESASPVTRGDQVTALESLWSKALATQIKDLDANAAYVRLLFAVGFTRVGAVSRAKDLVAQVEVEMPAFEGGASAAGDPNPILMRLYISRLTHTVTQSAPEAWEREVESIMAAVPEARRRDRAELFRKRSEWLRSGTVAEVRPSWQHRAAEQALLAGEADPTTLADVIARVFEAPALFDHERTDAIERGLRASLRTGNEQVLGATLDAAQQRLDAITILGHRASAIGACLQAAATLSDAPAVERLLDRIVSLASTPDQTLSVRDLLLAVNPGIAALRKMGAGDAASRLLDALMPIAAKGSRDALRLRCAIAEGYIQLKDPERSLDLLDATLTEMLTGPLDYNGRFDVASAALSALRRLPNSQRVPRCERVFDAIESFGDNFTTRRFYATYKLLVIEKLIDAITDEVTLRNDKIRSFLEGEEQVVRRKILADWRTL